MTSPILVQESFRGRYDNGSETTATWIAATNIDFDHDVDVMFRIRFTVAETNARNSNTALTLYFSYNGGAYQDLTTTSSYIRYASSTYVTDGTLTTQQISTGTFVQGSFDDNNSVGSVLLNNSKTEMEYGVIIQSADVVDGDTIAVRVYNSSSPLNSYTATPTFTITEAVSDPLVNKSDSVAISENRIITLSNGVRSVSDSVSISDTPVVSVEAEAVPTQLRKWHEIPELTDMSDGVKILEAGQYAVDWDGQIEGVIGEVILGGTHFLYYMGSKEYDDIEGTPTWRAVGVATSPDGVYWTKYAGNPVITHWPTPQLEEGAVSGAMLVVDGTLHFWYGANTYTGGGQVDMAIRYCKSTDGFTFTDDVLILGGAGNERFPHGAYYDGSEWSVYYTHIDGTGGGAGGRGPIRRVYGSSPNSMPNDELITSNYYTKCSVMEISDDLLIMTAYRNLDSLTDVYWIDPTNTSVINGPIRNWKRGTPAITINPYYETDTRNWRIYEQQWQWNGEIWMRTARMPDISNYTFILDQFNRANGSLGSNWTTLSGSGLAIYNQTVRNPATSSGTNYPTEKYVAESFDKQNWEFWIEMPMWNLSTTAWDGFTLSAVDSSSNGYSLQWIANGGTWSIRKVDGGSGTTLGSSITGVWVDDGDAVGIRRVGNLIQAWHRVGQYGIWELLAERTDSTYHTTVEFSIYAAGEGGSDPRLYYNLDNFGGGDIPLEVDVTDSIGVTENAVVSLPSAGDIDRSVSDAVGLSENRTISVSNPSLSKFDTVSISENRVVQVEAFAGDLDTDGSDTVTVDEEVVYYPDEIIVSDYVYLLITTDSDDHQITVQDTAVITEQALVSVSSGITNVSDSVGVSENVSALITTVVTLTSIKDTTLRSDQATTNYGNATPNYIGESNAAVAIARTLYQFDVSSIPSNAVCVSATFRIYATADFANNSGLIQVYRLLRSWVEGNGTAGSGATWNTYDGSSSWGTIGANNTSTDRESSTCGTYATTASETLNEFKDITLDSSLIQDWWDGSLTNNGVLLKTQGESDDAYGYASREYGTSTLRPKLVVEYYLSGDAPTLGISVNDTVTTTEQNQRLISTGSVNVSDSVGVSENRTVSLGDAPDLSFAVQDPVNINDQDYAQVSSSNANVSDSISITESRTLVVEDAVDYHDASGQDQVAVVDYPGFQPDIIWVFEHATISIEVVPDLDSQISDSVSVTENTTVSLVAAGALAITTSDAIGVGESSTVSVSYPLVSKSDTATVSESTTVTTSNPSRSVLDTITVSESSTVTSSTLLVSTADTVTVNETTIALVSAPVVAVFDSAAVGETAIVSLVEAGAIDISVSDTVSTADSVVISLPNLVVTKQENILVSDTANVTLAEASAITVFVTDTITTTDNVSITLSNLIASVQENVAVSEGINLILAEAGAINIVASDYPTITESTLGLTSNPVITKQDSITVSEARTLAIGVSASVQDNVSVSENRSVVRSTNTVSKSEAITVSESKSVTISSPVRRVQETINVTEARTLSIGASSLRVQDTVSVGENRSVVRAPNAINRTDNVTVSENRSVTVSGLIRGVQDGITVTDSSIVLIAVPGMMNAIVQDSITLTENVSAVATPILRAASDSISLSDSATVTVSSPIISRSETITVSESVQGISSSPRIFVNDSLVVDDTEQVRVATSAITVSDSLSVGEYRDVEVGEYAPYLISVQDGIILSEYANIFMPDPLRIGVYESPLVVDSPTVTVVGLLLRDTLFKGMWKGMKTGSE